MRKKRNLIIIGFLFIILIFQGCSKTENKLIGTWYGENDLTITFNEDGTFISDWILNGRYTVNEGEKITLNASFDTKELEYDKENNLLISNGSLKFFRTEEELNKSIEDKISESLKKVQVNIVGKWKRDLVGNKDEIEFFEDGTYIHSTEGYIGKELGEGKYSLEKSDWDYYKEYCIIKLTDKEGNELKSYITINNKSMYLDNIKKSYEKID